MIAYEKLISKVTENGSNCGSCYVFHRCKIQNDHLSSCYLLHLNWFGTISEDNNTSSVSYEWNYY